MNCPLEEIRWFPGNNAQIYNRFPATVWAVIAFHGVGLGATLPVQDGLIGLEVDARAGSVRCAVTPWCWTGRRRSAAGRAAAPPRCARSRRGDRPAGSADSP